MTKAQLDALDEAISECGRFLRAAKVIKARSGETGVDRMISRPSKCSAACKRASMDLTRSLAQYRRA